MKKPEKTTILLALFTILTLISIITIYTVYQTPTEETTINTLCSYISTATYDYTAILEHNTIYNNITILKPNEGTIYTKITRQINLTLTYTFQATIPADTAITYSLIQTLKTGTLSHQINTTTQTTTNQTQIQITIPRIIKGELDPIIAKLATETGVSTSTYYSMDITPTFTILANTTAGQIHELFTPTLTIEFQHTDQGDITTIGDLYQTKAGEITENQTITRQDVINQRNASYILTTISVAGLFFSSYFYTKTKPPTLPKKQIEKLIASHKELIAKTTQQPPETKTTIEMETLEDLAKIAEILARPILHTTDGEEHTFYIIDGDTKYQLKQKYRTKGSPSLTV
jgi:hypothetical protein